MTPYIVQLHQAIAAKPQSSIEAAQTLGWPKSRAISLVRQLSRQGLIQPIGHAPRQGYVYGLSVNQGA